MKFLKTLSFKKQFEALRNTNFKETLKNIRPKTIKWIGAGILSTFAVIMGGYYLIDNDKDSLCHNALYLETSNMHLDFQKNITFKVVDGKFINEVWYQKGNIFYSEKELDPNFPNCEIDVRKTENREITRPMAMNAGFSVKVDSLGIGIIPEYRGVNMIFISDYKSSKYAHLNQNGLAFYYVDCFIPTSYLTDNFKMDVDDVGKITAGVVNVRKIAQVDNTKPSDANIPKKIPFSLLQRTPQSCHTEKK